MAMPVRLATWVLTFSEMTMSHAHHRVIGLMLTLALGLTACSASINDSISVAAGEQHEGALATVNGSIEIGEGAEVTGSLRTVNGGVRLGEGARSGRAETVNGSIRVARGAQFGGGSTVNGGIELDESVVVSGGIRTVNGRITTGPGTRIDGDVATTNGTIRLLSSEVTGKVATTNGNVHVLDASRVAGGIHLRKRDDGDSVDKELRVIIGRDSVVGGPVLIENPARLFVHESAVIGEVTGAEVERYTGDRPE